MDSEYGRNLETFDVKLGIGGVEQETFPVTATADSVNRTNAEVLGVIESAQIKEIPVSGRNWAALMLLAPGAINYGDGAQRSIRFSECSWTTKQLHRLMVLIPVESRNTLKADTRLNIALDAIQEFRVSTSNYTAETGAGRRRANQRRGPSAGTNQFHGGTFYARCVMTILIRVRRSMDRRCQPSH